MENIIKNLDALTPISNNGLQLLVTASFLQSLFCAVVFAGTWWSLAFTDCDGQRDIYYYIIQNRGFCHDESIGGLPHCTSWVSLVYDDTVTNDANDSAESYRQSRSLAIAALIFASASCVSIFAYCYLLYIRLSIPVVRALGAIFPAFSALMLICVLGVSSQDTFYTDLDSYYEVSLCSSTHSNRNVGYVMAIVGVIWGPLISVLVLYPVWIFARPEGGETSTKGMRYVTKTLHIN
jgi:hypothetical protein